MPDAKWVVPKPEDEIIRIEGKSAKTGETLFIKKVRRVDIPPEGIPSRASPSWSAGMSSTTESTP